MTPSCTLHRRQNPLAQLHRARKSDSDAGIRDMSFVSQTTILPSPSPLNLKRIRNINPINSNCKKIYA